MLRLADWSSSECRLPLILEVCWDVGKTYIVGTVLLVVMVVVVMVLILDK